MYFRAAPSLWFFGSCALGGVFWISTTVRAFTANSQKSTAHLVIASLPPPTSLRRWARHTSRSNRRPVPPPEDDGGSYEKQQHVQNPKYITATDDGPKTETTAGEPELEVLPSRPKIVVIGATGRLGRCVVEQLLESSELQAGATVVVFARNYDKAVRVLYYDLLAANSLKRGPTLHIIEGELLDQGVVFGKRNNNHGQGTGDDEVDVDHEEWLQRAKFAAAFYGNSVSDYDDGKPVNCSLKSDNDSDEALSQAISGCTAIISCVGSVRPTNAWSDLAVRPLMRLLRPDVSSWCADARHPFYTIYKTNQKVIEFAEREQQKRQAAHDAQQQEHEDANSPQQKQKLGPPRIRFIRISDLGVAERPWNLVPVLANIFRSMTFRYQDMTEMAMEQSLWLDTVVIRPGDLVDDERPDHATLQVDACHNLVRDPPTRVGREDVASLAVATALVPSHHFVPKSLSLSSPKNTNSNKANAAAARMASKRMAIRGLDASKSPLLAPTTSPPFHCTLGVRWAGDAETMHPYPAQGTANLGHEKASRGLRKALEKDRKRKRLQQRQEQQKNYSFFKDSEDIVTLKRPIPVSSAASNGSASAAPWPKFSLLSKRNLKPYGICVAVPVYAFLALLTTTLVQKASAAGAAAGLGTTARCWQRLAQFLPPWLVSRCAAFFAFVYSLLALGTKAMFKIRGATTTTGANFIGI